MELSLLPAHVELSSPLLCSAKARRQCRLLTVHTLLADRVRGHLNLVALPDVLPFDPAAVYQGGWGEIEQQS